MPLSAEAHDAPSRSHPAATGADLCCVKEEKPCVEKRARSGLAALAVALRQVGVEKRINDMEEPQAQAVTWV
jgi:hypothetical protein